MELLFWSSGLSFGEEECMRVRGLEVLVCRVMIGG